MPPRIRNSLSTLAYRHPFQSQHLLLPPTRLAYYPISQSFKKRSPQIRAASVLSRLSDNPKAYHKQKRRGRGPSSGLGKTSGRGHKGQKQHGKVPAGFEGGQTPQHIVQGIRGFKNNLAKDITPLPLTRVQSWVAQGRLDPSRPITPRELLLSRCIHQPSDGIKLLANSNHHTSSLDSQAPLKQPLHIVVSRASASAITAVERAGGSVTTRYYTKWSMQQIVRGRMDPMVSLRSGLDLLSLAATRVDPPLVAPTLTAVKTSSNHEAANSIPARTEESKIEPARIRTGFKYRLPDPTRRKDLEYYRDPDRRGYLAYTLSGKQGPSLFFATEQQLEEYAENRKAKKVAPKRELAKKKEMANRLW